MYDKSKKTWSQRLKITKNTENNNTTAATTTTSTLSEAGATVTGVKLSETAASTAKQAIAKTKRTQDTVYNANNFAHNQIQVQQYHTVAAAMHLPTLQLNDYHFSNGGGGGGGGIGGVNVGYEYLPSALSRSMKFAEPWIYGTVRGVPARPSYQHLMPQAPASPSNYMQPLAVVICSCPEYLNGTKRDVKKASVCKKCKGSRLPLTPIGGTMRLPASGMLAVSKMRSSGAATVRVVSTSKKARPTILDPQKDPYDMMRRTRLLSPEPSASVVGGGGGGIGIGRDATNSRDKDKSRGRGKSASPVRGRSRKRNQLPVSGQKQQTISGGSGMREEPDSWLVEDSDTLLNATGAVGSEGNTTRRSILRCNVNPYDLISHNHMTNSGVITPLRNKLSASTTRLSTNSASQNEFMPPNDDFNVADAALTEEAPPFTSNLKVGGTTRLPPANKAAQALQGPKAKSVEHKTTVLRRESRTAGAPNTCANVSEEDASSKYAEETRSKRNYNNVQAIAGQRISLGDSKTTAKSLIKQNEDGRSYESITLAEPTKRPTKQQGVQGVQGGAEKQGNSHDFSKAPPASQPKRPPRIRKSESSESAESEVEHTQSKIDASKVLPAGIDGERVMSPTLTPNQNIKSILKRPSSRTSENAADLPNVKDQQTLLAAGANGVGANAMTPTNQGRRNANHNSANASPSPTAKSQFYIPLPQIRKKVQFSAEERIVHALESDTASSDEATELAEIQEVLSDEEEGSKGAAEGSPQIHKSTSNYEYYNRKREQQRMERLENVTETESTQPSGQSAQLLLTLPTQDALLAELKQYSDLVTQVIAQASNSSSNSSNNNNNNNNNNNTNNIKITTHDYDGYNFDDAAIEIRAAGAGRATSTAHYEDLSHITIGESINNNYNVVSSSSDGWTNNGGSKNKSSISSSSQQHFININNNNNDNNSNSNNNRDMRQRDDAKEKTMSLGSTKTLLTQQNACRSAHSSTAIKTATTAPTSSTSLLPTTKATNAQSLAATAVAAAATVSHVIRSDKSDDNDDADEGNDDADDDDDDDDDGQHDVLNNNNSDNDDSNDEDIYEDANGDNIEKNDDDRSHATLGRPAAASVTAPKVTPAADDVLKAEHGVGATQNSAPPPTKGAAISAPRSEQRENNKSKQNKKQVKQPQATQSRKPIRRTQSERHPRPTTASVMCTNNASGESNSNGNSSSNNNNENNNGCDNNDYQLEDHTTNGDLRFVASSCAASSSGGYRESNNNNSSKNHKKNKNESRREEAILSFKDTMALRGKLNRNDSRDLFARPREPPPPPPTPPTPTIVSPIANVLVAEASAAQTTSTATTNTNRAGNNKVAAVALMATETEALLSTQDCQANISTLSPLPASSRRAVDNSRSSNAGGVEKNSPFTGGTNGLEKPTQLLLEQAACAKTAAQLAYESRTDSARRGMQQMVSQNMRETKVPQQQAQQEQRGSRNACESTTRVITNPHGSSLSSCSTATNTSFAINTKTSPHQQRTVVRVAPFNKTKTTSEVHRLKISHTDNDDALTTHTHLPPPNQQQKSPISSPHYSFHYNAASGSTFADEAGELSMSTAQKKTSILINGDDCYSTMNLSCDDASTPLYQSSVVVADHSAKMAAGDTLNDAATLGGNYSGLRVTTTSNTVTINVSTPRSAAEELIYQHNKINTLLSQQPGNGKGSYPSAGRAIIPIKGSSEVNLQRSASSTSSTSTSSMTSLSSSGSGSGGSGGAKRGRTLIRLGYEPEKISTLPVQPKATQLCSDIEICVQAPADDVSNMDIAQLLSHEDELLKILRNPVEAVKRNLVPHVCGRSEVSPTRDAIRNRKMKNVSKQVEAAKDATVSSNKVSLPSEKQESMVVQKELTDSTTVAKSSFITKLLEDPMLSQVADGLETETVAELIENSLKRLQESRSAVDMSGTKDNDDMNRLINLSLQKIKEERQHTTLSATSTTNTSSTASNNHLTVPTKDEDGLSNRGSISSANSFASANNYEMFDFDANESDCYQSCSSEITTPGDDDICSASTRSKFYQMLVDATLAEIEMTANMEEDIGSHHYESIRNNGDPIYEEINDMPPPLPQSAPPLSDTDLDKKAARSIFEGASKYDILSYLVDAKERGVVREETFDYPLNCSNPIIIEEEAGDTLSELGKGYAMRDLSSRASVLSDSSEDTQSMMSSLSPTTNNFISGNGSHNTLLQRKGASSDIERNDSGVGSETSKSSRSKYQNPLPTVNAQISKDSPIHLCEDCDGPVETQVTDSGIMFAPLVCRKCGKKRVERKEIITEIVETEEKYGRDLQIILEEFCHPMLVAGLLTQEQLSAIFLNTEELLENNQTLAERMRDALDIALEQGDDDLLTVNIGKIFLDFTQMLHAFESYCVRQAGASLLLANLEKEKELLRIFLKVSQMENAVLRRMNLNSFLMVPVQRVTKYPLLLARLYKVTPAHLEGRSQLKQAQEKIELHLNHINQEAKDVPTKLWRRISSSSPNRRASCEIDMINIKLRKMAIDILEWNHDEVRFAMEGKLLYTQPTDSNWKKARTIKLTPVNALLVTNGKPSANYKAEKVMSDKPKFPRHNGIREASLLVVKEKCGRYTLIREPLYLDRCVVCSEADWDDYFEVQEISSKDTFIFKAEDGVRTKQWYSELQYHAQGMGAWRKRRNALANIMINGMLSRN